MAYDAGEYETASALFTKIYETTAENYALFYKGISLMELQQYEEALSIFNNRVFNENKALLPFCKWYAALANLKLENKEEAIAILEVLAKTENPQKEAAIKLLARLE